MKKRSLGFTVFVYALLGIPLALALGLVVQGIRLALSGGSHGGDDGGWLFAGAHLWITLSVVVVPLCALLGFRSQTHRAAPETDGTTPGATSAGTKALVYGAWGFMLPIALGIAIGRIWGSSGDEGYNGWFVLGWFYLGVMVAAVMGPALAVMGYLAGRRAARGLEAR